MSEQEWLAAPNTGRLLWFIAPTVSDRRLHLFAIACSRRIAPVLTAASLHAVDLLERFVEGLCGPEDVRQFDADHDEPAIDAMLATRALWPNVAEDPADEILTELLLDPRTPFRGERAVFDSAAYFVYGVFNPVPWERRYRDKPSSGHMFRPAHLVHEVFGNPFRPVAFDPAWRTDTALSLARVMHETRDFTAMPILADALQDAGCEHADVLDHCRDPNGVHVRGCWVVDLVLGKN